MPADASKQAEKCPKGAQTQLEESRYFARELKSSMGAGK